MLSEALFLLNLMCIYFVPLKNTSWILIDQSTELTLDNATQVEIHVTSVASNGSYCLSSAGCNEIEEKERGWKELKTTYYWC